MSFSICRLECRQAEETEDPLRLLTTPQPGIPSRRPASTHSACIVHLPPLDAGGEAKRWFRERRLLRARALRRDGF